MSHTLWPPMDYSTPSLLKLISIELMMPSNHFILCWPLIFLPSIFPSIRVFSNEFQLFASTDQTIGASASILAMNIQRWSLLGLTGLISLLSKGLSRVFSNTTVQKYQFIGAQLSLWFSSHIHTWPLVKPHLWLYGPLSAKWCLCFWIHCLGLSSLQGASVF